MKLTNWTLLNEGTKVPAQVPGDITVDLYKAGLISDPYIAENYKDSTWVGRKDFTYECEVDINEELYENDELVITFKGIDLYSEILVNGVSIGKTDNAFLAYSYDIKPHAHIGKNIINVKMSSTLNKMDTIDTTGYFAIFNIPRIFLRKPQCHFGWDWAPKICAYGIIDDVTLEGKSKFQINDIRIVADDKGSARFHVEVNYTNKNLVGPDGEIIKECPAPDGDTLVYYISKKPFGTDYERFEYPLMGNKNFCAFTKEDAELWWPRGYGEQPLYNYCVELWRGNKVVDVKKGRFAYRTVSMVEEAKEGNLIGMDFYINGVKVYLKGSNWIPPECFTGVMEDEKYVKLINLAKDMNLNILRVWGGGAYEKDIFFDLCDEAGILTWQDIALACADIPEDNKEFLDNLIKEVEYQVKRLRNHPSLIYWCGGNEKTGTYGNCITHGDFLVNCTLYGIVDHLDGTRPYRRQSPHSYTDIGNESTSGDSHYGNFELALNTGMKEYRNNLAKKVVPFASECAVLGPSSEETLRKIFPSDHLWPMDSMWKDRFMENPYAAILMDFPHRELYYAEQLHGEVEGLHDFVIKAMSSQSESLRVELDYSRGHTNITGAWLNWMFDDIWPSGTWSIVDYYLEPKQAYYQLRRSFKNTYASYYQDNEGKTWFFLDNQGRNPFVGTVRYEVKTYDGEVKYSRTLNLEVDANDLYKEEVEYANLNESVYIATYDVTDGEVIDIYSPTMFIGVKPENKFSYDINKVSDYEYNLVIYAESFVKSLFVHMKDNYRYHYSDNYLDIEKGAVRVINITSDDVIDVSTLQIDVLEVK